MPYTSRFGLTYFGGLDEGSFDDDGEKYTHRDRLTLDRVLTALEQHSHGGGDRLEDPEPADAPTLQVLAGEGSLDSGTYYYRVSYMDQYGLETAPGDEVSIILAGGIEAPGPVNLEAEDAGTLPPGLYYYVVTAHVDGSETPASDIATISVTDWRSVRIMFVEDANPAGADEISIWRQGPLDGGFTRLVTLPIAQAGVNDTWLDNGSIASEPCPCDPESQPPLENLTGSTNAVKISIPQAVAEDPKVARWRIYRSGESGSYAGNSLVAEVVETTGELGGELAHEYVDVGAELGLGRPLLASQTLGPSPAISPPSSGNYTNATITNATITNATITNATIDRLLALALRVGVRTATNSTAIDTADPETVILADASSGALTVTLPAADAGRIVVVKKVDDDNTVTVTPASGLIDGAASVGLASQYDTVRLVSDGTNWFVI